MNSVDCNFEWIIQIAQDTLLTLAKVWRDGPTTVLLRFPRGDRLTGFDPSTGLGRSAHPSTVYLSQNLHCGF